MRFTRLFIGIIVVMVALWIIVGEQMAGASGDAVVNARVVVIRANTAGSVDMPERVLGSRVEVGEVLATVDDPLVDVIRLNDLRMERAFLNAELERIGMLVADTRAILEAQQARGEIFHARRLQEIRTRLLHARARLDLLESRVGIDAVEQRVTDAVDPEQDRLPAEPVLYDLALDHARERVAVLEIALAAAEAGVFLGDGYNDSPNAQQYSVVLEGEIAGLNAALAETRARAAVVDQRIEREEVRVNALRGGQIASPVTGFLWTVLQADGVTVQRGDPLLTVVDCRSVMVTLPVSENVYNRLKIGQEARVRLNGSDRVYDAAISRLAGSGAATIYQHLAVAPSQQHLERYDVTLNVPELNDPQNDGCLVGRTGRAFFEARPLDWLRRF
ncbi:HlyD family secretion protein [Thetidibacter halocola]|uniref:HlyD family efflux transporter periplasmic adaptor subunit n=1 Tax=Thetidibacter halocola TaxID=2827239 RepID=A0A8J7WJM5_9RHOB|nr:HlyD family efflux transporter periplasmic adaptor subunit [Thetidibacter halocola]MBS0126533.1 HlyD family efflux transporter periplasmic adaptor subunit [Thetidibacter halocola]